MEATLTKCFGLDTRTAWADDDAWVLAASSNLQVDPGGSISTRPALVKVVDLSSSSVGLYARGGILRALVASGQSLQATAPTGVIYDPIGQGGTYDYSGKIGRITASDSFGVSPVYGPYGFVSFIRLDTGQVEQHWIKEPPATGATYTNTLLVQPFQPGQSALKFANKIMVASPSEGYLRYCSTLNGPIDWTTAGDAGFEAVLQFINGTSTVTAIGVHRSFCAVFYADAVQLWALFEDPSENDLAQLLKGPGTSFPGSVSNILGDCIFLSASGFANLSTSASLSVANASSSSGVSSEARFAAIGERIKSLTSTIASTATPVSIWSQKRSQYLCAVGTTVYVYSVYTNGQATGDFWTTWTLPTTVDYMVEVDSVVYIRSGNTLYKLDDTTGTDYDGNAIAWSYTNRALSFGAPQVNKALRHLTVQSSGAITAIPVVDGRTLTALSITFPASTTPIRAVVGGQGRRLALACSGTGMTRIDGMVIEAGEAGA